MKVSLQNSIIRLLYGTFSVTNVLKFIPTYQTIELSPQPYYFIQLF